MEKYEIYCNYLTSWIKQQVESAKMQGVIVGISGGIDSAVVACLAKNAFPKNHLTVIMPCHSLAIDEQYAQLLVNSHKLTNKTVDLTSTYDQLVNNLSIPINSKSLVLANIKPRLRMTTLYAYAQLNNYLVLGTDNADEYYTGYFTKYGDGGADLVPIIHLLKQEVKLLAQFLNVPSEIINRAPSAGLWDGQTDESEMGFTYQQLDDFLQKKVVPEQIKKQIEFLHFRSEHKRQLPQKPKKIDEI